MAFLVMAWLILLDGLLLGAACGGFAPVLRLGREFFVISGRSIFVLDDPEYSCLR